MSYQFTKWPLYLGILLEFPYAIKRGRALFQTRSAHIPSAAGLVFYKIWQYTQSLGKGVIGTLSAGLVVNEAIGFVTSVNPLRFRQRVGIQITLPEYFDGIMDTGTTKATEANYKLVEKLIQLEKEARGLNTISMLDPDTKLLVSEERTMWIIAKKLTAQGFNVEGGATVVRIGNIFDLKLPIMGIKLGETIISDKYFEFVGPKVLPASEQIKPSLDKPTGSVMNSFAEYLHLKKKEGK